jgi:hypothetical protein
MISLIVATLNRVTELERLLVRIPTTASSEFWASTLAS